MLVKDNRGSSSPVLVKIIRALTPKGRRSSSSAGGERRPAYGRQSSVNRVFQIVKEGLDGVSTVQMCPPTVTTAKVTFWLQ